MDSFLKFFYEFIQTLIENIVDFFVALWQGFWGIFDFPGYFRIFEAYSEDFTVLAWILAIVSVLFVVVLFVSLIWLATLGIRRYLRFRRTAVTQEDMLEQVAELNAQVEELIDEKAKIMALKVSQLGLRPGSEDDGTLKLTSAEDADPGPSRFVKLTDVDTHYQQQPYQAPEQAQLSLEQLCHAFRNFACSRLKLYYPIDIIRYYFSGMATSKIIILEGISGTGKTSLPYAMGKFLKYDTAIVPVQPSWRDKSELIGYFNEFTRRFNETDFLKALYEGTYRKDVGFIVLDEMNLARVEYYFAEILSLLEMPNRSEWKIDVVPDTWDTDPTRLTGGKLLFPTNLWFVGTANNDDSTFTITDKVYDRSTPISINNKGIAFEAPDQEPISVQADYLEGLYKKAQKDAPLSEKALEQIDQLDSFVIQNFRLAFGNRILKQIKEFVPVYIACGGTELGGVDYMLTYKIFRKFEVLNISFAQDNLRKLILQIDKIFGKNTLPLARDYITNLINRN